MISYVVIFCLGFCALNWLLFAWSALIEAKSVTKKSGLENVELQGIDSEKMLSGTGKLAEAFSAAGAKATAAAMSLAGLLVSAILAGIDKF